MKSVRYKFFIIRSLVVFALGASTIIFFQNCGVEQPKVEREFASLSSANHQSFTADTKCSICHEASRPTSRTLTHNFNHGNASWVGQDCITCHTDRQRWGSTWTGGQYSHDPAPGACLECHANQMPKISILIENNPARPFTHTAGVECLTCHTSTSQYNSISNWRPATSQPSGLVGSKRFTINVITPSFSGSIMIRPAAVARSVKLEIDHGDSQVGNLACVTCHTNSVATGTYSGALFHRNIATNPATCVECHTNARPEGIVGAKQFMRHEAVHWISNSIGAVRRGTAAIVGAECTTCHLNTSSMPQPGALPLVGSKPFSNASFHLNTLDTSLSSCLDCHAHNRPTGSANFTDLVWKNKTNVGAPPFTTFDLTRHAPNVDCATCHKAPSIANSTTANWANGYFLHSNANLNCINCHTSAGVTSTNHAGFNSNCISCHTGSVSKFPNPIIGDWKLAVTGGVPSGVVGDKVVASAITCIGVQASLPSCRSSSPNTIAKGMDHTVNANNVSCQNCHGTGVSTASNGKFHTAPVGVANWTAPAAADLANCLKCHDPTISPLNVQTIKNIGIVGSQVNLSTGATPFAGVNHGHLLIAGQQCIQCHTAPTPAVSSNWNLATKLHSKLTPAQISTCSECHYKRMPSGALPRKNQLVYKGTHVPQKFTHTSALSMPTIAAQQCSNCHTNEGNSWTTAGKVSFHNKVISTNSCNTCHNAPLGVVTSGSTGISFNHGTVANIGDCVSCHQATVARVSNRIPTALDWDGGTAAPATYTIPSHTSSGITIPGYTGTHSTNTNCISCHGTGNYKVITDFDHMGLPAGQNSCVSCHLGSKADVAAFIASTSPITMKTLGSRHHPTAKFNGTSLSCVGCHTTARGASTFTNANGINYPTASRAAYVAVGCGSPNNSTFSCHEANQQIMTVPTSTGTSGKWR